MSKTPNTLSPEICERAVRMVPDNQGQHGSCWQAIVSIAAKICGLANTLKAWVKPAEVDGGQRAGVPADMAEKTEPVSAIGPRTTALERENRALRGTNENTNGRLRQSFPKGTDLAAHGPDELNAVTAALNGRPRKTLGWRTPAETLDDLLIAAQADSVATTS